MRSPRYRRDKPLTYSMAADLPAGQLIKVSLQREIAVAIVTQKVAKPAFDCKPVSEVIDLPALPSATLALLDWLQAYYPAPIGSLTQTVLPADLPSGTDATVAGSPKTARKKIDLNDEQARAVQAMDLPRSYILHGRTGSGKTRVYAALIAHAVNTGKSAIVLTPEIGLVPQLADSINRLLEYPVISFHSKMTAKQRKLAWVQILTAKQPVVVIGPRSAIFTPVHSIGVLILDEFHEPAYKQEQQPYYYAPRVAGKLAELTNAKLILGSATPGVVEYYVAEQKKRPIIELTSLAGGSEPSITTTVVDSRDRSSFGESTLLSSPLVTMLKTALTRGEQSLLYLNRRGTARLLLCQVCGWQAECPRCDVPLTFHGDRFDLLCHNCGYSTSPPPNCPTCNNPELVFRTAGTKAVVDEVQRLFPEARIRRFDTDNRAADRLEKHHASLQAGDIDILIGTQMIAKGLDLPHLSSLGVLAADSSLGIPDYTARERTYQLLTQLIGRVGRGHTQKAEVIIQTYDPQDATLQAALERDWQTFYAHELGERKQFIFPPFCYLLKLSCERASSSSAEKAAKVFTTSFPAQLPQDLIGKLIIHGPFPSFHERNRGRYRWEVVCKSTDRRVLLEILSLLPKTGWHYDIDPVGLA